MAYNSKYTGAEVEALLEKVAGEGAIPTKTSDLENDSGFITEDALAGYATTATVNSALAGKEDKLVFYSEDGGDATLAANGALSLSAGGDVTLAASDGTFSLSSAGGDATLATDGVVALSGKSGTTITTGGAVDINTGDGVNIVSGDVTIADGLTVGGATSLNGDVTIDGAVQTRYDIALSVGGVAEGRVTYHGVEIATVYDVSAATANIATPADSVNATKNAVLALTSDDLVQERDKWFEEGSNGYPSAFEVMDYSATTYQVRVRCHIDLTNISMMRLECNDQVVATYPPYMSANGAYRYAFDILVPYMDGAFLALPYKYTIEDA